MGIPSTPRSSVQSPASTSSGDPGGGSAKFIGKHARDQSASLYLSQRCMREFTTTSATSDSFVEPLQIIAVVPAGSSGRPAVAGKKTRLVVGVLGRLVCDYGLQLVEHIVFQSHLEYVLDSGGPHLDRQEGLSRSIFDTTTQFIAGAEGAVAAGSSDWVVQLQVRLPPGMPPSCTLTSTAHAGHTAGSGGGTGTSSVWGLNYYVCAFLCAESFGSTALWDRLKAAGQGKVVLAVHRHLITADNGGTAALLPPVTSTRSSLTSSKGTTLTAAIANGSAFKPTSPMHFSIKLSNPGAATITAIRVTLKQLVTVRFAGEAKQSIKNCFGRYEFTSVYNSGSEDSSDLVDQPSRSAAGTTRPARFGTGVSIEGLCRDGCSWADTLTITPRALDRQSLHSYQLAQVSGSAPSDANLCPSFKFDGLAASIGGGLDRLRYCSVEYYANVHAVFKWNRNLIVKLPFTMLSAAAQTAAAEPFVPRALPQKQQQARQRLQRDASNVLLGDLIDLSIESSGEEDITTAATIRGLRKASASSGNSRHSPSGSVADDSMEWLRDVLRPALSALQAQTLKAAPSSGALVDREALRRELQHLLCRQLFPADALTSESIRCLKDAGALHCRLIAHLPRVQCERHIEQFNQGIDAVEVYLARREDELLLLCKERVWSMLCGVLDSPSDALFFWFLGYLSSASIVRLQAEIPQAPLPAEAGACDLAGLAAAFKTLTDRLFDSSCPVATLQAEAADYLRCVCGFFASCAVSSNRLIGVAAFWHFQFVLRLSTFLHAHGQHWFVSQGATGLLVRVRRFAVSNGIRQGCCPSYYNPLLVCSGDTTPLVQCAQLLVDAMQQL